MSETISPPTSPSPKWGSTTKMVVGLTIVAIIALLFIQFRNIVGPLILAFMLALLLHPVASYLSRTTRIAWRTSVNLIYLIVFILVIALFAVTGLAIVQQLQSLIGFVQLYMTDLPALVTDLSQKVYHIGPFELSLAQFDLQSLVNQVLAAVQPALGRAGSLISTLAGGATVAVGWGLFVLIISYFLLAEAGKFPNELIHIEVPGYRSDIRRLNRELTKIWSAFLRGQLTITLLVMIIYAILMTALGVRFAWAIAILAGLGRFVPYLGPLILWIVTALVAFFQGGNYFGLVPLQYAILVVAAGFIIDQVFDNLVTPRFMGETLGVHPAAVLVAAIIAANLIGLIGLLLAAPVVATLKLVSGYVLRKMLDAEPFPVAEVARKTEELPWQRLTVRIKSWWRTIRERFNKDQTSPK